MVHLLCQANACGRKSIGPSLLNVRQVCVSQWCQMASFLVVLWYFVVAECELSRTKSKPSPSVALMVLIFSCTHSHDDPRQKAVRCSCPPLFALTDDIAIDPQMNIRTLLRGVHSASNQTSMRQQTTQSCFLFPHVGQTFLDVRERCFCEYTKHQTISVRTVGRAGRSAKKKLKIGEFPPRTVESSTNSTVKKIGFSP